MLESTAHFICFCETSFLNSPKFLKFGKAPLAFSSPLSPSLATPVLPNLPPPGGSKSGETGFKPGLKAGGGGSWGADENGKPDLFRIITGVKLLKQGRFRLSNGLINTHH